MTMFKAWCYITNSVNDSEVEMVKYFNTISEAEDFVAEKEEEVEEWNKPENSPSGGRMSTRYIVSNIEEMLDNTVLDGLTYGNLKKIIFDVARNTPPAIYGSNGQVT